jgi:serine/threonine-protein kinase HipA
MSNKCFVCFHEVDGERQYHNQCAEKLFGTMTPPVLDFGMDTLKELAIKAVSAQTNITGVQAKISLSPVTNEKGIGKLAVDYKGKFILKPPSILYLGMPEVEAATMQMAEEAGISVAPHGLIAMNDGNLAYITRRMDRVNKNKVHQEDLCQLSGRLTEDKYKSSCERVGKVIKSFAVFPKLAAVDYFKIVVFNFIHGNADMHLKNYSMTHHIAGMSLTASYDLLNSKILLPEDQEQSALTINGKKSRLRKTDFDALAINLELLTKQRQNVYKLLLKTQLLFHDTIERSYMSMELKDNYKELLNENIEMLKS